jgi:Uma2 family endonuclease
MAQAASVPEPLITGTRMELEEFLRRWEALPDLKNAELIDGIVFVSSPVGLRHSDFDSQISLWLGTYSAATPGARSGHNATCIMLGSSPQPDCHLRLVTERGSSRVARNLLHGAPELVVEIVESSYSHDFGPKKALYQRAGVREYITVEAVMQDLIWRVLEDGSYVTMKPDAGGILRSRVFPGLWLNPADLWALDDSTMLALLRQGLDSPEHKAFIASL